MFLIPHPRPSPIPQTTLLPLRIIIVCSNFIIHESVTIIIINVDIYLDTSVAVKASAGGVVIFALIVVAVHVVAALIVGFVMHRRSKTKKAKVDPNLR